MYIFIIFKLKRSMLFDGGEQHTEHPYRSLSLKSDMHYHCGGTFHSEDTCSRCCIPSTCEVLQKICCDEKVELPFSGVATVVSFNQPCLLLLKAMKTDFLTQLLAWVIRSNLDEHWSDKKNSFGHFIWEIFCFSVSALLTVMVRLAFCSN